MGFFDYKGRFWDLWGQIQKSKIDKCIVINMNGLPVDCGFASLALYFARKNVMIYLYNAGKCCKHVEEYVQKANPNNLYIFEDKPDFLEEWLNGNTILD